MEDAKGTADLLVEVRDEGKGEGSEAALLTGKFHPCQMAEFGIHRDAVDVGTDLLELVETIIECCQFGRADKSAMDKQNK